MNRIVIIGAGGFGREIQWLIERINAVAPQWIIEGYVDDGLSVGAVINDYAVLGGIEYLQKSERELSVVCAVGAVRTRKTIIGKLLGNTNLKFPNIIDPTVEYSNRVKMGQGNIICAATIITVNIEIGDFNIINLDCTIGHDVCMGSFITVNPSVNVSGNVLLKDMSEIGTGTQLIQGVCVGKETIVGAGAVVVRNLPEKCVAVGSPAKPIKYHE